jgi:hypothetical protein
MLDTGTATQPHDHGRNCLFINNPCSNTLVGVVTLKLPGKRVQSGSAISVFQLAQVGPSKFQERNCCVCGRCCVLVVDWPWSALPYSRKELLSLPSLLCCCCHLCSKRAASATVTIMRIGWWMSLKYLTYMDCSAVGSHL